MPYQWHPVIRHVSTFARDTLGWLPTTTQRIASKMLGSMRNCLVEELPSYLGSLYYCVYRPRRVLGSRSLVPVLIFSVEGEMF